jgi:hypothetical protein
MASPLFAALLLNALPLAADTVIDVRPGDRVVLENLTGTVLVEAWDQDRLEVTLDDEDAFIVERSGSTLRLVRSARRGDRRSVEVSIRAPSWIDLEIGGRSVEATITGIEGNVRVANVRGDVRVENAGEVEISSIEGEVTVVDARGDVTASSQAEDVTIVRAGGTVQAHSGDGAVTLEDLRSSSVRAETQDGDIEFSGTVVAGGTYGFFVHDGDATIALPASAGVQASVSTFDGEFESEFPVVIRRFTGGRQFEFTLGDGSARLEIQVFDGEIRLVQRR